MTSWAISFLAISIVNDFMFSFVGVYRAARKQKLVLQKRKLKLNELSVLIPFRNEEFRIDSLITSIKNQINHPKEYLFIDDHSDDFSVSKIKKDLEGLPFRVITCDDESFGKKAALRKGLSEAVGNFILTFDADIEFSENYFETLNGFMISELSILPVKMIGNGFLENLFASDYNLGNVLNRSVYGFFEPIMASGANLLFDKNVFLKIDSFSKHKLISSGDDMFLLKDFRSNQKSIDVIWDEDLMVRTSAERSFKEFLIQRARWIGKTNSVNDQVANLIGSSQMLLSFGFVTLLLTMLFQQMYLLAFTFFIFNSMSSMIFAYQANKQLSQLTTWLFLPVFRFWNVAVVMFVFSKLATVKVYWKGRKINQK